MVTPEMMLDSTQIILHVRSDFGFHSHYFMAMSEVILNRRSQEGAQRSPGPGGEPKPAHRTRVTSITSTKPNLRVPKDPKHRSTDVVRETHVVSHNTVSSLPTANTRFNMNSALYSITGFKANTKYTSKTQNTLLKHKIHF